jgi:two-component system chemotaxis response regulator CheB
VTSSPPSLRHCDALVVGASAGGIEALMTLLPALPANARISVLVVLHLPRGQPSALVEIFTPKCALPVREADDKEPLEVGTVYFAPPDYHLLVDRDADGSAIVALSSDEAVNYSRPAIDVLFESAADHFENRLGCILLTGANSDGAAGVAAVRAAGGVTIAQDPGTALATAMPKSAIDRGVVDHVLTLEQIRELLTGLRTR